MLPNMKHWLPLLLILCFFSCIDEENPLSAPPSKEIDIPTNSSINAVYERVIQEAPNSVRFEENSPLWLEGYVISNDFSGNFYKELYIQDTPENPTRALRILVDETALSLRFPVGRKIYVRLNGLGAGKQNGVVSIGSYRPEGVGPIPSYLLPDVLLRTAAQHPPVPKLLSATDGAEEVLGQWVYLKDVQLLKSETDKTFAGEAFDRFNGERRLRSCHDGRSFWLSSSIYADFKSVVLPKGSGTLQGILTRDFYDEKYILKINHPSDLQFTASRCDGFFEAYFETAYLGKFVSEGWENIAVEGTNYWEVYENQSSMGKSVKISAYGSGDVKSDTWLLTPELDLSGVAQPELQFSTSTVYPDRSSLEVYLLWNWSTSEALNVTPKKQLAVRIAHRGDDSSLWIPSGRVPLPTDKGPIRIGFRYQGSGKSNADGTFELDEILILNKN
jgi:hypothetical protein